MRDLILLRLKRNVTNLCVNGPLPHTEPTVALLRRVGRAVASPRPDLSKVQGGFIRAFLCAESIIRPHLQHPASHIQRQRAIRGVFTARSPPEARTPSSTPQKRAKPKRNTFVWPLIGNCLSVYNAIYNPRPFQLLNDKSNRSSPLTFKYLPLRFFQQARGRADFG